MKGSRGSSPTTGSKPRPSAPPRETPAGLSREQATALMQTIINRLQVLALRRPRALIIVAQVLDGLLDEREEANERPDRD
jgi:hypothetical protein